MTKKTKGCCNIVKNEGVSYTFNNTFLLQFYYNFVNFFGLFAILS